MIILKFMVEGGSDSDLMCLKNFNVKAFKERFM